MRKIKNEVIKEYQCCGCVGSGIDCFKENETGGIGCGGHVAGTFYSGIGKIYLGIEKGFNRLGNNIKMIPNIYKTLESSEWEYDMWNIPVWKYLNKKGHTFVRGIMPRRNEPFLHIFLENCINKIDCIEITQLNISNMD